jgi:hypothetical protein
MTTRLAAASSVGDDDRVEPELEELRARAAAAAEGALAQLTELAGGRSMCAIGRSGESFPAAKYAEGRMAALDEASRNLRRGATRPDLDGLRTRWDAKRAAASGGDWLAYWTGGADALAELLTGTSASS